MKPSNPPRQNAAASSRPAPANPASDAEGPGERLQKVLAAAGIGSRRTCEVWIEEGRVRVNGLVVTQLGTKVDPSKDKVTFDGHIVRPPSRRYYIALNKPRGVVSSRGDVHAARLVTDLVDLSSKPLLRPVGRLDADSEGLIFLTDDGDFLYKLTHPKHHVPKTYRAIVHGVPKAEALARLTKGIMLEDGPTAPAENVHIERVFQAEDTTRVPRRARGESTPTAGDRRDGRDVGSRGDRLVPPAPPVPEPPAEPQAVVELTIFEGRNRQVRRMLAAIGHPVVRLTRISIGPIRLTGLPSGAWRHLTPKEVAGLTDDSKLPTNEQEHAPTWHAPRPSRPPRAPSSPSSTNRTPRSRPPTSSNSPRKGSTTG